MEAATVVASVPTTADTESEHRAAHISRAIATFRGIVAQVTSGRIYCFASMPDNDALAKFEATKGSRDDG